MAERADALIPVYNLHPVTTMMTRPDQIEPELEQILSEVAVERGPQLAAQLRPILLANLERGRIDFYLNGNAQAQLRQYVGRVVDHYDRLSPYLHQLQQARSAQAWEALLPQLQQWATTILRQAAGLSGNVDQLALECATVAAGKLLTAYFPYDTEFVPWAYVLVRNVCHQLRRREPLTPKLLEDEQAERLPDLALADQVRVQDLRHDLLAAVEQLSSEARRQVIVLHYFQGDALPDIAARLNKTMTAIYKLHFDALAELRKIWASQEHKE